MKKLISLVLVALMLVSFAACGDKTPENTDPVTIPTTDDPAPTNPQTPVEPETKAVNIITGLDDMGDSPLTRPVGIMVANNDFIQDEQVGLAAADMWMEAETEGGITRIMAVFANTARVPEAIGPVRSARSPFFHVVEALGLAYCHAGGSYTALNHIANSNIADLDVNDDGHSWRDNDYPHDYEYRLRTNGDNLTQYMLEEGYKTQAVCDLPWTFGEQTGTPANKIGLRMSGYQRIGFTFNSSEGVYYKTNGSSENRHCDISGTPITAKSVIVLYTDKFWENDTTIDFYLQSGKGYVFSNGVTRRFDWTRDANGFTMTEENGEQLTIAAGKVYLCVISTEYADSITIE